MKKIYLPLFAAAMLASCSNEMDEFAAQTENGKGFKVDLTVVEEQPQTRITWGEIGAPTWEKIDKFSVLKIGAQNMNNDFKVVANAAYTTENGVNFTSENVLFIGKHALVYPLQEKLVDLDQRIVLEVGTDGDKGLGANSVFVGTNLIDVTADGDENGYNSAGYHKKMKVGVRAANAGFIFKLNEVNALELEEGDPAVEITKVELKNKASKPFATKVTLQNENAGGTGKVLTKAIDLKDNVYSTYEGLTLEAGAKAEIAAMPSQATAQAAGDYEIVITTNYGIVTIDKAIDVTNKDGKIQIAEGPTEKSETNADDNLSFTYELSTMIERAINPEIAQPRIVRTVNVDMSTADINGLEIKNSEQLIAAYRAFDLMNKKSAHNVTFTLTATDGKFTLTKAAIDVITKHADGEKAFLDFSSISQLTISGYEEGFIPVIDQMPACTELVLAEGNKLKLDVNNAAAVNMFGKITNNGELQLTQGTGTTPLSSTTYIYNNNKLTFGEGETTVPSYTTHAGTMEIAEGQTVKFAGALFANGSKTTVKGELISTGIIQNVWGSTIDVEGKLLNITGQKLENAGTINIKNVDAQVILSANKISDINGTVYVTRKDNNLNTGSAAGYVKLPVSDEKFVMSTESMGIANYIEFSGKELTMEIEWWNAYVELQSNVKVTAEAAKVGLFVVNKNVEVTIADGSVIETQDINNEGKIYNYGTFKYPAADLEKGTIYDL